MSARQGGRPGCRFVRTALAGAVVGLAPLLLVIPTTVQGQQGRSVAEAVRTAPDGKVRLTFTARPNVCGEGNSVSLDSRQHGSWIGDRASPDVEWETSCEHGPVRVVLSVQNHAVTGIHTYVGGRWRPAAAGITDIGNVRPQVATDYLLTLARELPSDVGKKAIFPAVLADSVVVWPTLLTIARDERLGRGVRRDAVFWLGQFAGEAATAKLATLAADDTVDRDVRESAVFALSQRPSHEGVPALIQIAQTNRDPDVRRKALFWLGQSNDPRAIALFEKLLTER